MSATALRREKLTTSVVEIFTDSDETYGYRRVHAELGRRGVPAGLELVRSIMQEVVVGVGEQQRVGQAGVGDLVAAGAGNAGDEPVRTEPT